MLCYCILRLFCICSSWKLCR